MTTLTLENIVLTERLLDDIDAGRKSILVLFLSCSRIIERCWYLRQSPFALTGASTNSEILA